MAQLCYFATTPWRFRVLEMEFFPFRNEKLGTEAENLPHVPKC